jgi:hypothetical protein
MRNNLAEIVVILDRSGSMQSLTDDTMILSGDLIPLLKNKRKSPVKPM